MLLALILLVGASGCWYYELNRVLGKIPSFSIDADPGSRPAPSPGDGTTILIAGLDGENSEATLRAMLADGDWQPGRFRSDTIMLLHLEPDGEAGQLISIPRDSYVPVRGYGRHKINAALSYGGPSLLLETVEDLTGLRIDHTVLVDFRGFAAITDTLGGASVTLPSGNRVLDGAQALAYVRERKTLARGDFDRVQRQQNLVRALALGLVSRGTLTSPVRVLRFAGDLGDTIAVDDGFTPSRMRDLAWGARGLQVERMRFITVPYRGTGTIDGASVVLLDPGRLHAMFSALRAGNFESWFAHENIDELPEPDLVH